MKVKEARHVARDWVLRHAIEHNGYVGAYISGSIASLRDEDDVPLGSDVDINLVTRDVNTGLKPGKFQYMGALLEVTYIDFAQVSPATKALQSYHLAGGFRFHSLLDDPTGVLSKIQNYVGEKFANEFWVRRRCQDVQGKIKRGVARIAEFEHWPDQVSSWLFSTGMTIHILLVAGLQNPTVRLRYLKARTLLADYGLHESYPGLLKLLGCDHLSGDRVSYHLHNLEQSFDAAAHLAKTPYFFSTDISAVARPIAIDASRQLISNGDHKEAVFWITATFARCYKILISDAPASAQKACAADFEELLYDLGIRSKSDLLARAEATIAGLPPICKIADRIMAANPLIQGHENGKGTP